MGIKAVLTSLDGVDETIRGLYKKEGEKFHLDLDEIDEHPSVGALKRAKDYEKAERVRIAGELTAAKSALETAEDAHRESLKSVVPQANVTALEDSYKMKLKNTEDKFKEELTKKDAQLNDILVTSKARELCAKISTAPELLLPVVMKRLAVEEGEGGLQTRVLGLDGKPSAATLQELEAELLQTPAYAPIIIGSKAAGGGASGGPGSGGATKKLSELSESDRLKLSRDNPAEFRRLMAEAKAAR